MTKRFQCPEPGCGKTTQSYLTMHTHVVYKHNMRPDDAKEYILSNLSKLEEVQGETGITGRERLNRLFELNYIFTYNLSYNYNFVRRIVLFKG